MAKLTEEKSNEVVEEKSEGIFEKEHEIKEFSVSKTVLKTGLLTALVFLLVLIFAFTVTAFISPKFVSDLSLKAGAQNLSARFAIAQYERTKNINDLATAVERSISAKRHSDVADYGKLLIEFESGDKDFRDFVKFKNDSLNAYYKEKKIDADSDYYNFIYGNYVYSLYKINEKNKSYNIAVEELDKTEYTANNPLRRYIDAYIEDSNRNNNDLLKKLEKSYNELELGSSTIDKETKTYGLNICFDLVRLYKTLGEEIKVKAWETEFENLYKR